MPDIYNDITDLKQAAFSQHRDKHTENELNCCHGK